MNIFTTIPMTLAILCLASSCTDSSNSDPVGFERTEVDLGLIDNNASYQHLFPFKVNSPSGMNLIHLAKTCACASATLNVNTDIFPFEQVSLPLRLKPGLSYAVALKVDFTNKIGPEVATATLHFRGPNKQVYRHTLTLKCTCSPAFKVSPSRVTLGYIRGDSPIPFNVKASSPKHSNWALIGDQTFPDGIQLVSDIATPGDTSSHTLSFVFTPSAKFGFQGKTIRLNTTVKGQTIDIPVNATLPPPVVTTPSTHISFGRIDSRKGKTRLIKVSANHSGSPFCLNSVFVKSGMKAELIKASPVRSPSQSEHIIKLQLLSGASKGSLSGKLIIHTDIKDYPVIELPFSGFIR